MSSRCHAEASDNTPEELLCWDPLNSDCFQALLEQSGDAIPVKSLKNILHQGILGISHHK
jgi:hypothetical protein